MQKVFFWTQIFEQNKKIYQHAGKCDNQKNLKDILDAAMVSTTEGVTDDSPNVPMTSMPVKKPSARKSLYLFTNIWRGPSQDVPFFYTSSHLSELQSFKSIISTIISVIFIFK